jgi:phage tail-like protein
MPDAPDAPVLPGVSSSWLEHLPALFQEGSEAGPSYLGRFLLAFEEVLTGLGTGPHPGGLEGVIAGLHRAFAPYDAPHEFLEWLAGWAAVTLRVDFDEARRREFIARAVPLYRLRGTRRGLEEMVRIYTGISPTIVEVLDPLEIGATCTVGVDTVIGGGSPHFFAVTVRMATPDPDTIRRTAETVAAILDQEKPAHTRYSLTLEIPSLQVGVHARIGVDTLLSPPFQS